jgi:hypothetical protein
MRKSEVLLTLALLGAAAMATWLWGELHAERARNAELSADLNARPVVQIAGLEPQVLQTMQIAPPAVVPTPTSVNPVSTQSSRTVHGTQEEWDAYQRRRMQNPNYREAWRAQQRLAYALRRENVMRLLGFTPEQADAVVEIAIDHQLRWYDRPSPKSGTEEDAQQQRALYEQDEREDQEKLAALLGPDKHARFQEYMESRATRLQVDQLRPQFTGNDLLRDDQVEPLIAALHVERARFEQELREYRESISRNDPQSWVKDGEREIELRKATNERMHAAAAPILSSSQVKRLDDLLKRDLARREAEARMKVVQAKVDPPGANESDTQ